MRASGARAVALVVALSAAALACEQILGLPDPIRDDSIGADAQPDRSTPDAGADANGNPDTGCGDIQTSKNNCGSCGYVCKFADCIGGFCSGTPITDAGAWDPKELQLGDAGTLYFGNNPDPILTHKMREIVGVDLTSLTTHYVVQGEPQLAQFSVVEPNVYFAVYPQGQGSVTKCATSGCTGTRTDFVKNSDLYPDGVLADGTDVYFTYDDYFPDGGGAINRCSAPDCDAGLQKLLDFDESGWLRANSTALYWTDVASEALWTCQKPSCSSSTVVTYATHIWDFAADDTYAYFTDDFTGTVERVLKGGGTPEKVAANRTSPQSIAVDATYVYWLDGGASAASGSLHRCPKAKPCTPDASTIDDLANGIYGPNDIALDATNIYYASDKGIFRIPKPP